MPLHPVIDACPHPPIRARRGAAALVLALCAALLLAAAAPASAITRGQAAKKALAALGSKSGSDAVVVLGLPNPLRPRSRVTQTGSNKTVGKVGAQRAFFFYEDAAPFQLYPHLGRVALVGATSGKVKVSKGLMWAPLVNGKLPAFLKNRKLYSSAEYRVFARTSNGDAANGNGNADNGGPNHKPKADELDARVKKNTPKHITLTGSDPDGDLITFAITTPPDHGTLSGQPPDVTYTPNANYLGKDKFAFHTNDGTNKSNTGHVSINVVALGDPPTVTTSAGCTSYSEQTPAVAIDAALTVSDPDDPVLDHATVRIPVDPPAEGEDPSGSSDGDELLFTDQNGIVGTYEDSTGTLTLSGEASLADYQAALRSVRYRNLSDSNPSATRDVIFTVNDAGSDSAPATKQICISSTGTGGNDKPVGETSEGALQYTENDGPVPVDGGFVVGDADSANLSGATIKFVPVVSQPVDENGDPVGDPVTTVTFDPAQDALAYVQGESAITGSYDSESGVMTLSGTASLADYEAAIRSVTYENSSERPSDAPRRIQFQLTDSDGATSIPKRRDIFVTPVNDAPVVTTSEGSGSATGPEAATVVDPALTVGDVDDDNLESARVRISNGSEPGDQLALDEPPASPIAVDYNVESGILTLTGTASVADYQTLLRQVEYRHPDGNPSGTKTIEFTVNDGDLDSEAATKNVEVNDKPVLFTTNTALAYTEGDGAVAVDSGITASDADSANLSGATVQISSNYSAAEDTLGFADQNGITSSYDSDTGTLTLTGSASVADYQAALGDVRYQNTSDNPSTATRTVTFQVDDGAASNNLSDPVTRDIEITPVNDAPVVTTSEGSTSYPIGSAAGVTVDENLTVTDADDTEIDGGQVRISSGFESGDDLVYVDQNGIAGVYNTGDGVLTLTGTASVEDYQTALQSIKFRHTGDNPSASRTVEFKVNDGDADSNAALKSIDLVPPNDAPVVTTSAGSTSYTLGDSVGVEVDNALTVTDADDTNIESGHVQIDGFEPGDDLVFADQLGISGSFDSEIGVLTLTGTAPVADYQTALRSVKFRHFGDNQSASRTVAFKVNDGSADSAFGLKSIDLVAP